MSLLDPFKRLFKKEVNDSQAFEELLELAYKETRQNTNYSYEIEVSKMPKTLEVLNTFSDGEKVEMLIYCLSTIPKKDPHQRSYSTKDEEGENGMKANVKRAIFRFFLRKTILFDQEAYLELVQLIRKRHDLLWYGTTFFAFGHLLKQLENLLVVTPNSADKEQLINKTEKIILDIDRYDPKELLKINLKFTNLRKECGLIDSDTQFFFEPNDSFSKEANNELLQLTNAQQVLWAQLLELCQKSNGSKPTKKFETESVKIINELGKDHFKQMIYAFIQKIIAVPDGELVNNTIFYDADPTKTYINSFNATILKGLIWSCAQFHDEKTLQTLYELALRSYKKIPGIGQEATSMGNATVYTLYKSKGLTGIGLLTRLRLKVKHNSTLVIIQKYLMAAAESKGVSMSEIEDFATDSFKLVDGKRLVEIGDYHALIRIIGIGKCELLWIKENGTEQKSVPAIIKSDHADKLKKIKSIQKQIEQTLSAQRDRLDRLFRIDRLISKEHFETYFIQHGLLSYLGKRLIWTAKNGQEEQAIYWYENAWRTIDQQVIDYTTFDQFKLWHPANASTSEVLKWRQFFMKNEIQQPIKQAFREVYILTPAEVNTRTYSNRMAAHILKQHQFVSLARSRNWTVALQGNWDGGDAGIASLLIPEFNLLAQYWTEGIYDMQNVHDNGVLLYVTTDQIRFTDTRTLEPIELIDVPTTVFSEVLRDTDLFVGVASIGNDPNWQDTGQQPGMSTYWQSYSFGDLSEVAKNRKELLANLLPKLKIAAKCSLTDKFLVVTGKLRTYKIHLGSTNILMEPNDQYLCIVQDRSVVKESKVFIPFDGDQGLSVILSKAILLANDDTITDQTILTQINR